MGEESNNEKAATDATTPVKDEPDKIELAQATPFAAADSLLRDSQTSQIDQARLLAEAQAKVGQAPETQVGLIAQDPVKNLFDLILAQNKITERTATKAKTPGLGDLQIDVARDGYRIKQAVSGITITLDNPAANNGLA
jgi:hypothetical protein